MLNVWWVPMKATYPKTQRAAVTRKTGRSVLILFPLSMSEGINQAVTRLDTDRSKFVRNAVRAKLDEMAAVSK